ncbi:RluA family pseudouridine synthase [Pseudodesulfovibrio sp. JC047]|uniref:RluA family pseudouridine synthase n=1 Tax=Pseudodesulfovibrio sp. JC047 TaxID=2683199 RepID=UPI0013D6F051|nr:RluA family pseudouridine synthase [Pseudodesulfovibrio sp. JC047]NDV18613.1 RluA family pseudouridine synthase [Pseudodesulfovibrio sp. JC047]
MPKAQFITVSDAESGQKLLQYLERRLTGDVPKSAIQKWIRKGQVRVDKGRKKPFDRITAGQIVRIPPYTPGAISATVTTGTLKIVHEDESIMAIAKPAGLAAHGGDKITDSVTARLRSSHADAAFMPTLAHRLDRDTSGLLLAAKTYEALRTLNDCFAAGKVGKLYLAWVQGIWAEKGTVLLEDRLGKNGAPGQEKVHTGTGKTAKALVTGLISNHAHSLVAIQLLTGRTHQIRVQLAARNHPVCGDHKYGQSKKRTTMRLHCAAMRVMKTTITLAPNWSGSWDVPSDIFKQALCLLDDA